MLVRILTVLFFVFSFSGAANALTIAGTGTSNSALVQLGQNNTVQINWAITDQILNVPSPVTSTSGVLTAATFNLGTINTPLSQNPGATSGTVVVNIAETLTISQAAILTAFNANQNTITYTRNFTDADARVLTVSVNFALNVGTVTASGSSTNNILNIGKASSVQVVWSVTAPNGGTLSSTGATLETASGTTLQAVSKAFSQTVTAGSTTTLSETVSIPVSTMQTAINMGQNQLVLRRSFQDLGGATSVATSTVSFYTLGSSTTKTLVLNRLALMFDDSSVIRLAQLDEELKAFAQVTYSGQGEMKAVWEVADPTTTQGSPVFRTLRTVRQVLGGIGSDVILASPSLPSGRVGDYLVRLRITSPVVSFTTPEIRYFVAKAAASDQQFELIAIDLLAPKHLASLTPTTSFAWQPVSEAIAYQLEFFVKHSEGNAGDSELLVAVKDVNHKPVSGMVVPAKISETMLSNLAGSHLIKGNDYLWRIRAIGVGGSVLGESPLRAIIVK